jgi:hypothetical protein
MLFYCQINAFLPSADYKVVCRRPWNHFLRVDEYKSWVSDIIPIVGLKTHKILQYLVFIFFYPNF